MFLRHFSRLRLTYFPIVDLVDLIPNKNHTHVIICILLKTLQPHLHVFEGCDIRYVESQNHALRLFVERLSQSPESLLSGCVPNLALHRFIRSVGSILFADEVQTESGHVLRRKLLVRVHSQE